MSKHDLGHRLTEKRLEELEKRIAEIYKEARDSLDDTVKRYFAQFEKRDKEQKAKLDAGEITKEQYSQWRLNQIGRGERFKKLRDEMAERYTNANEVAVAYTNDETPGVYALNRNYAAYTIEQTTGDVGFTLYDEKTVERLIVEQPDLMPYYPAKRALKRGIDLKYGKQQITVSVTSGILQGKSIGKIANDLQSRMETMNRASAIRTARTAVTGAQNAGRQDSYVAAEKMGIEMEREWVATLDNRTRHAHAILDGQRRPINKPFQVDGQEIMFPGDPKAKPYLVYNCRCTLIAAVKGVDTSGAKRRARDPETGESVVIENMTYAEWAGWKKQNEKPPGWRRQFMKKAGIENAATVSEVEKAFREKDWFIHGTGSLEGWRSDDELTLAGCDIESAKYVYRAYEAVFAKYPELKNKLAAPVAASQKTFAHGVYADCSMGFGSGGISINTKMFQDYKKMMDGVKNGVKNGWWAPDGNVIIHEIGHAIDDYLSVEKHVFGTSGKKKTDFMSNKIRARVLKKAGISVSDIKAEVSEYATTNPHEWFAECFTEYMTNRNPRRCAKALGEELDEIIKEAFRGN